MAKKSECDCKTMSEQDVIEIVQENMVAVEGKRDWKFLIVTAYCAFFFLAYILMAFNAETSPGAVMWTLLSLYFAGMGLVFLKWGLKKRDHVLNLRRRGLFE